MIVGEYGVIFQMGVSFNMSAFTSLSLTFTKPDLTTLTVIPSLGVVQISTPEGIFSANTYVTYTFLNGQVNQIGDWTVRLTYMDATPAKLISTIGSFIVSP